MLKEFKAFWQGGGVMQDVVQALGKMVADASYVYTHAWEVCIGQAVIEKTEAVLRRHDKDVNRGERAVRRMIVEHLTINPGLDLPGCVATLIMAKDIERVGDHAGNIFDLGSRIAGELPGFKLYDRIAPVGQAIGDVLPKLEHAILHMHGDLAREVLDSYQALKPAVKDLQETLFAGDLSGTECVVSTLMTRYLMRLNAHIGNAASGIVFPVENIDFVSRGLRKERQGE